jgi:predicted AAA+ superfamily ATPase
MTKKRLALHDLERWIEHPNRKPLLIRGARQVGKSTLVRMLGATFDHFIELNAEKPSVQALFQRYQEVDTFLKALLFERGVASVEGRLLLFIDEIQESPEAIRLLRYFYEERPDIYVIAAGSLLDFALGEVRSFPVGRVSYYYLHPLNFEEFLEWKGEHSALEALRTVPVPGYAHEKLRDLFHEYALVGGMPEIVHSYVNGQSLNELSSLYSDLWQAYLDDIEKYTTNSTQRQVLRHVIRTGPMEQDRIKFAGFGQSNYGSREVGEALRNLELARVVRLIYPTTQVRLPIVSDFKKRPRLQFIDTGLLNHALQIQAQFIGLEDLHHVYRGFVLQHLLTQELIAQYTDTDFKPHFWVREKANANAEVDLVYPFQDKLLPIEIKAGQKGRLRSLHQFVERADHALALRFLNNTLSVEEANTPAGIPYRLANLPYYLMSQVGQYARWLVGEQQHK